LHAFTSGDGKQARTEGDDGKEKRKQKIKYKIPAEVKKSKISTPCMQRKRATTSSHRYLIKQ
jgi:hypothetical protein